MQLDASDGYAGETLRLIGDVVRETFLVEKRAMPVDGSFTER